MTAVTLDTKTLEPIVYEAAQRLYRRFRRYVTLPDVAQEMWLYLYEHPDAAELKRGWLVRRLADRVEPWVRREKASKTGFSVEDEAFYSLKALRDILPDAFDPEATPTNQVAEIKVTSSKEGYGNWETSLADVRLGLASLDHETRNALYLHYGHGYDADRLATYYGIDVDAVYKKIGRALRRLQKALGGPNPYGAFNEN